MTTVDANDVRIPATARAALAKHEEVVVLNHGRPAYVIVSRDDYDRAGPTSAGRRGRSLKAALEILASAPLPDPAFAEDMKAVRESVGPMPADLWEHS
jgi:hypothetical protein